MSKKTTQQDLRHRSDWNPNPNGVGGFGDHPEHQSPGGWNPKHTFSYQMNRFKAMTINELEEWNKNTPKNIRTVAEDLAFRRVFNALTKLEEFKEVADRTEGKPKQRVETDDLGQREEIEKLRSKLEKIGDTLDDK